MNYPEKADVILLLCEDYRLEAGNKVTLLGWYIGSDMRFAPDVDVESAVLPSVCLIFLIRSGEGNFQVSVRIISPAADQEPLQTPRAIIEKRRDTSAVHVVKIVPFHPRIGNYIAELDLDGRKYQTTFNVDRIDQPVVT